MISGAGAEGRGLDGRGVASTEGAGQEGAQDPAVGRVPRRRPEGLAAKRAAARRRWSGANTSLLADAHPRRGAPRGLCVSRAVCGCWLQGRSRLDVQQALFQKWWRTSCHPAVPWAHLR